MALAALALVGAATAPPGRIPLDPLGVLLLVVPALSVAALPRARLLVLAGTTAALLMYLVRGYPGVVAAVPVLVALYAAVRAGHRRAAGAAVLVALVGGITGQLLVTHATPPAAGLFQNWFLLIGWLVAASVAGEVTRQHRAYLDQVERRARDAEQTREETARRRADEERLRIARELHDSLTHSISVITVQAGVAVHLARKRGAEVPAALLAVQQASGDAMRELRATLEVLRDQDHPTSGLDRLDTLVGHVRQTGLPVTVEISGAPRPLTPAVDLAAYRIIQEALTNATRHAGPATSVVRLDYRDRELAIRVEDDGRGTADAPFAPGLGLTGMRERVTGLGGSLHAGPRLDGGFQVHATLPLEAA